MTTDLKPATTAVGVTGPRRLTDEQRPVVRLALAEVLDSRTWVYVGDADGVDAVAGELAEMWAYGENVFEAEGREPWQLQQRSKRMVKALQVAGGTLHAWPNKHCPEGLTVNSWQGSGTWGTMRYAASLGVPVVVHTDLMPGGYTLPSWLETAEQPALPLS